MFRWGETQPRILWAASPQSQLCYSSGREELTSAQQGPFFFLEAIRTTPLQPTESAQRQLSKTLRGSRCPEQALWYKRRIPGTFLQHRRFPTGEQRSHRKWVTERLFIVVRLSEGRPAFPSPSWSPMIARGRLVEVTLAHFLPQQHCLSPLTRRESEPGWLLS